MNQRLGVVPSIRERSGGKLMDNTNYSVSLDDNKNYLATLAPDQEVGIPQHLNECLVARTLKWKYPPYGVTVMPGNTVAYVAGQEVMIPTEVQEAAEHFDDLWEDWDFPWDYMDNEDKYPTITVSTLRERMSELFA